MTVIKTDDGNWVNLDHVATASPVHRATGLRPLWSLCGADGHPFGVLTANDRDIQRLFATYIPAVPGATAYEINVRPSDDSGHRPTAEDVHVIAHAVIAWQLNNRSFNQTVDPVVIDAWAKDRFWHLMPDGSLCAPGHMTVASLDAAKAEKLTEAQKDWDRHHTAKATEV